MNYLALAEKSLAGDLLTERESEAVLDSPSSDLLRLLDAAFRVRRHYWGSGVQVHVLMNAKSGLCPEDCSYCSQSSISNAEIARYPMQSSEEILAGALRAKEAKAMRYCIVTSGRSPTETEVKNMAAIVQEVKSKVDIEICCCMGLLNGPKARILKAAGVDRVNHNLNTSESFHENICTTHTYLDRVNTLREVQAAGLSTCCGGILGMGETRGDWIDLALAVRELDIDSIPVNFLHPIEGTPLEGRNEISPQDGLKALCLFRFLNPSKEIRVAGGRERNLGSLQALALYPANSLFVDGYLTTGGDGPEETHRMIESLGFEIAEQPSGISGQKTAGPAASNPLPLLSADR